MTLHISKINEIEIMAHNANELNIKRSRYDDNYDFYTIRTNGINLLSIYGASVKNILDQIDIQTIKMYLKLKRKQDKEDKNNDK